MLKKIIAILLPVIIIVGGVYFYSHQKKTAIPENSAIKAIPIDASFIIESHKTLPLLKIVSQDCDIWKELADMPYFTDLNRQYKKLDSIVREHRGLGDILENEPLFISAHTNGMNHFNYLFICSVPPNLQSALSGYLDTVKGNTPSNNLQYEETTIHCIQLDDKNAFYYVIYNNIFISSFSPALIKESLRQLESGISLMNNAYFTKVLNASERQVEANVFLNLQTFPNVASALFKRSFYPILSSVQNFGQWMGLDVTINPNEVIMTGFTSYDSTGGQFLNLFQHQSSHETKAASVAPANTAFMLCHEFTDYPAFYKNYTRYLGIHSKSRDRAEWLSRMEQNYGMNLEKYFLPWASNEIAQVITEPSDSTLEDDTYVLVGANDINVAINKLSTLADSVASKKNMAVIDSTYMHHEIRNLNIDNVTGNLLGNSFDGVTKSWFSPIGNYIVFANSLNALKTFIYSYEQGNILEKDSYYKDYVKQHVESESGIYIYNNLSLSPILYAKYLDKTYVPDLKKYKPVLGKYHGLSMQFSYMQGMFYTNIYLKKNPVSRQEVTPLWQVQLDTTMTTCPYWVTDYATHEQYIMAEDKNKLVYLINTNGQIAKSNIYSIQKIKLRCWIEKVMLWVVFL
jgi:CO dehydrogenase/acetyl-CoA synthase epsilon subunit